MAVASGGGGSWGAGGTGFLDGHWQRSTSRNRRRRRPTVTGTTLPAAQGWGGGMFDGQWPAEAAQMPRQTPKDVMGDAVRKTTVQRRSALAGHRSRSNIRAAGGSTTPGSGSTLSGVMDLINSPSFQAYGDYNDSYQPSLAAARSAIENSYQTAMAEIQKREGFNQQLMQAYPGQINSNFDYADQQLSNFTANATAQANAAGGQVQGTPEGILAPMQAASAANRASRLSDVPLMGATAQGLFSQERQGVEQDRGSALAELAAKEEEMRMSAQSDSSGFSDAQNALLDAYEKDHQDQDPEDPFAPGGAKAPMFGRDEFSGERGKYMQKYNKRLVHYIRFRKHTQSRRAYMKMKRWIASHRKKGFGPDDLALAANAIWSEYKGQAEAISLALSEIGA